MTRAGKGKEKGESEYGASRRNAVRRRKSEAKMSGGKAERSGRNDDGQEKACDKAGRNACCRIKAKGADRGEKRNDGTRRRGKRCDKGRREKGRKSG